MRSKIDVLFVLPSLRSGGAERVMSFLAQNIDNDIFNASLLITGSNKDQKYQVSNIPLIFLNKDRVKHAAPFIVAHIQKHRPKIVISAIEHLNAVIGLIAFLFPAIHFVARMTTIRNFKLDDQERSLGKPSLVSRLAIKGVSKIICQSQDMRNDMLEAYTVPADKMMVINNPVTSKFRLKDESFEKNAAIKFITVGRLTALKGYERVLKALAKFNKPFQYTIIGSGDNREHLLALIKELGLIDKITLIAYTDKINDQLAQNDIYLQGSYVEGFPNALLESCATGTPAVVFDAPGGINEIIIPGINGYLAENESDFIEKLEIAISQKWNAEDIRETVYSRYSEEKILEDYEMFFQQLVKA